MDTIHNNIINDAADIPPVPPSEIFSNELVLEHIFRNLKVQDLKHCRGVNILWCREATQSIRKNHELSPVIIETKDKKSRKRRGNEKRNCQFRGFQDFSMDAEKFLAMISSSISFPCNNISLLSCMLQSTAIRFFLNSFGENIKQLEILNKDEELEGPMVKMIEDLLTKQVTKLQFLKIQGGSISDSTEFLNEVKLKNLTKLIVGAKCNYISNEFIGKILNAAVSLKIITYHISCYGFMTSGIFKALVGFKKAHLLDRCDFVVERSSSFEEQINVYEAVVSSKPKLKTISVGSSTSNLLSEAKANVPLMRLASIISKCLELNAENLVNIQNIGNFLRLPGLRIPPLAKVQRLQSQINPLKLMDGNLLALSFVETFPNLKKIMFIHCDPVDNAVVSNYLGNVIPCLNVTNCVYDNWDPLPLTFFEYIGEKFPNLTHLECGVTTEFLETSQHIWKKLTQLKCLEIRMIYITASVEANYLGLEAAFTGFSSETCRLLKNCITEGKDVNIEFPNLENSRINPSILNLKKLTFLNLTFYNRFGSSQYSRRKWAPTSPLLTAVTGQFAFALCPTLRVDINIYATKGGSKTWTNKCNPFLGVKPFVNMMNFNYS